jgi:hypothetical protein
MSSGITTAFQTNRAGPLSILFQRALKTPVTKDQLSWNVCELVIFRKLKPKYARMRRMTMMIRIVFMKPPLAVELNGIMGIL